MPTKVAPPTTIPIAMKLNPLSGIPKAGDADYRGSPDPQNPGKVSRVTSLSDFQQAARETNVKGVVWDRPPHPLEQKMVEWANSEEETPEKWSREVLLVAQPSSMDHEHCVKQARRAVCHQDILDACERLVRRLPEEFREPIRADAEALSTTLHSLCPHAPWLSMQLEIMGWNTCRKWHQDLYVARSTITYAGPGTWMADDEAVRFDAFFRPGSRNEEIVPEYKSIHRSSSNGVCLIKGKSWPEMPGIGLIHKSPNTDGEHRLILKVDLSLTKPGC